MKDADIAPVGALPAKQARSEETSRNIVEALENLLQHKAFEQITMAELAARAGITPGAIYRRFKNKDALLPHVFERYRTELNRWMGRVTPEKLAAAGSLEHALCALVEETLDCFRTNAPIFRTVHLYGRLHPELNVGERKSMKDYGYQPITGLLERYEDEVHRESETARHYLSYLLVSLVMERALYPAQYPSAGMDLSDEQFVAETARMIHLWLTA